MLDQNVIGKYTVSGVVTLARSVDIWLAGLSTAGNGTLALPQKTCFISNLKQAGQTEYKK